ncbi:hypothetical protein HIM_00985 [Hirsutella minnesotensis 3608]|nr:hypothetical protein HIM_00985 [Hirsutella minnesotensis 3608]
MSANRFRIAIVGAGPAGLTLARLLHRRGIPYNIFDLRQRPSAEELAKPSGSLDLHEGSGLDAIRELGLYDEFKTMTDDCSEAQKVADKHGNILFAEAADSGNSQERPEISRNKLNQLLLSRLPSSTIHWQHKLRAATASEVNGNIQTELDFGDKGKQVFDFVVGADGAWSKVRSQLTDARPTYAGQQNVTVSIRHISTRYPHLHELVGSGTFFSLGDRHAIISQRATQDTARLYALVSTKDEDFAKTHGLGNKTAAQTKSILLEGDNAPFKNFGPVVKELISTACDDETAANPGEPVDIRPMCTLYGPEVEREDGWQHKPGLTLVGDAAHLMPPNGEGVNMGMYDSLMLSKAISQAHDKAQRDGVAVQRVLDPLVKQVEEDMLERVRVVAQETAELREMMFDGDDCAVGMAEFFKSMAPPPE